MTPAQPGPTPARASSGERPAKATAEPLRRAALVVARGALPRRPRDRLRATDRAMLSPPLRCVHRLRRRLRITSTIGVGSNASTTRCALALAAAFLGRRRSRRCGVLLGMSCTSRRAASGVLLAFRADGRDSNPYGLYGPRDFKSLASTSSATLGQSGSGGRNRPAGDEPGYSTNFCSRARGEGLWPHPRQSWR